MPPAGVPAPPPARDAARAGAPAWYSHSLNTATSLRLILGIIPRVPRPLVPPIGVLTTAICLALLRDERRAVTRNQARIGGVRGARLALAVWRQFYSFSRFMVSYCDLASPAQAGFGKRLRAAPEDGARLRAALERGRGAVVVTAHLGNWEVGAHFLSGFGVPVNLVMHADRVSAAERWLMQRRVSPLIRVIRVGTDPASLLVMREALRRNEIVAVQGDRMPGGRGIEVTLFGGSFLVPLGPFLLARVCDAPLLPAFVLQEGWWRWRAQVDEPIPCAADGGREADLAAAAGRYAAALERAVRAHPDQWFNFFDLWPGAGDLA